MHVPLEVAGTKTELKAALFANIVSIIWHDNRLLQGQRVFVG